MNNPIVFFNIGWMDFYEGKPTDDQISGGGSYIDKHGYGHEIFNFKEHDGHCYGFVKAHGSPGTIKLNRLGAPWFRNLDNVTVVWTASHPDKIGTFIVGWYKNVTVYRHIQKAPKKSGRKFNREKFGYFAVTKVKDAILLSHDERQFPILHGKKGYKGQNNVWYADNVPDPNFISSVYKYIETGMLPKDEKMSKGKPKQNDPLMRIKVEKAAIKKVVQYFDKLGYEIDSVEKDNVGWDLTATKEKIELKLEVKGLSGSEINTELTPNEYYHLNQDRKNYRVCVVTKALKKKPKLHIFRYSAEIQSWASENGRILQFSERVSAKISV